MGNLLLCAPNHIDDIVDTPTMGGGAWLDSLPVTNINSTFYTDSSRSADATAASTKFDVDLSLSKDIKTFYIPDSNISTSSSTIRVRGSNAPAWSGVTVNGVNALNAASLSVSVGSSGATFSTGDVLTVAGDTTVYKVTSDATIAASSTGSVSIARSNVSGTGLAVATSGSEAVTCHSPDLTDTSLDTGTLDYFDVVKPVGSEPWGVAGVWDGKLYPSELQRLDLSRSVLILLDSVSIARYLRVEIVDTLNTDGYVDIAAFYATSVYRPVNNMSYGADFGVLSNTTSESSPGGAATFNREKQQRYLSFTLKDIPVQEAFTNGFDLMRQLDLTKDLIVVYDEDDTDLLSRRSFVGRFEQLFGIAASFYDATETQYRVLERVA